MNKKVMTVISFCKYANAVFITAIALYFLLFPGVAVVFSLLDPNLQRADVPRMAWTLFRKLTPRYEQWARHRIASGKAADVSTSNVEGTEWPLFGSVLYLWAVDALQAEWDKNPSLMHIAPREYARGSIEAAVDLVIDPNHASWVKQHWGQEYMHKENVFYRMLFISALTSESRLLGKTNHVSILRDQVESLANELDQSPHGILNDYPFECYPTDVLMAIAAIRQADSVLGTDHTSFVEREVRGFQTRLLDHRGLPPYEADPQRGVAFEPSRGCGVSYGCISASLVWPLRAKTWYSLYEKYFWQNQHGIAGFREFPNDLSGHNWYFDVDAGPVIDGIGIAASAFGVAASRLQGRLDRAYPLTAEMITASWPLPDGSLLLPRILSNTAHAPYLGEACILFCLTRRPIEETDIQFGGTIPHIVYIALALYLGLGVFYPLAALREIYRWRHRKPDERFPLVKVQLVIWSIFVLTAVIGICLYGFTIGMLPLLFAQLLPKGCICR